MKQFTKNNEIQLKFTATYHPATIEQAERFVQKLKKGPMYAEQGRGR
jgi:hypothetical protein